MGICNSVNNKSSKSIRSSYKNKNFQNNSTLSTQNSFPRINKALCKLTVKSNIKKNKPYDIGFFVNIQLNETRKCLITNSLEIGNNLIDKKEEIIILLEAEKFISINLDREKRFIKYLKQPFNITIIEILDSDLLTNDFEFLNYDDLDFNFNDENILNKDIFVMPYSLNTQEIKKGKILKLVKCGFEYSINYNDNFLGNPIISVEEGKIIGISNNNNSGIFIGEILKEIEKNKEEKENINFIEEVKLNVSNNNNLDNEIIMKYTIDNDKKIKLLGNRFIENNRKNCKLKICGEEKEICEYIEAQNIIDKVNENTFLIRLKIINKLKNISHMFADCKNLISINNISNLNTSKVTNINNLFFGCESLLYIPDISNWDTTNVENMGDIFSGCSLITSLPDLSKWNTSKVKNMSYMFSGCESLSFLSDISNWDTSNVTNFSYMFHWCKSLTFLPDISRWDTSNASDLSWMFSDCSSLEILPKIGKWKTNCVTDMNHMFFGCSSLKTLPDISKWNTGKVKDMSYMFNGCVNLDTFPQINEWNTKNLKNIRHMFQGCKNYPEFKFIQDN